MARRAKNINTLPTIVTKTITREGVLRVEPLVTIRIEDRKKMDFSHGISTLYTYNIKFRMRNLKQCLSQEKKTMKYKIKHAHFVRKKN